MNDRNFFSQKENRVTLFDDDRKMEFNKKRLLWQGIKIHEGDGGTLGENSTDFFFSFQNKKK